MKKIPSFTDLCTLSPESLREKYPHLFSTPSNSRPLQLEYPTQTEGLPLQDQFLPNTFDSLEGSDTFNEYSLRLEENGVEPVILQPEPERSVSEAIVADREPDWDHLYDLYREMHVGRYGY